MPVEFDGPPGPPVGGIGGGGFSFDFGQGPGSGFPGGSPVTGLYGQGIKRLSPFGTFDDLPVLREPGDKVGRAIQTRGGGPGGPPGGGFTGFTGRNDSSGFSVIPGQGGTGLPLVTRRRGMPSPAVRPQPPAMLSPGQNVSQAPQRPMGYAQGGGIPGPTDTVPAMLTPGEGVLTHSAMGMPGVGKMMTLLNAIADLESGPAAPMGAGGMGACPECGQGGPPQQMEQEEPEGYSLGGWVGKHPWAIPLAAAAAVIAAPAAAPAMAAETAGLVAGGEGAAASAPAAGSMMSSISAFAGRHPGISKFATDQASQYLGSHLGGGGQSEDSSQYMMPYPQRTQGYSHGGEAGAMCSTCGRPMSASSSRHPQMLQQGYAAGGAVWGQPDAQTSGKIQVPKPTSQAPTGPPSLWGQVPANNFGGWKIPRPQMPAPVRPEWSQAPVNPDLQAARDAGYFDPRGNQMLLTRMNEGAQGTADALVRRQMSQADLGGMDPAQRAVARQQALRDTGRGVQDIMANARFGVLGSQDEFYKRQYESAQVAEQARLAAERQRTMAMEQIHYTGLENRSTQAGAQKRKKVLGIF